MLEQYMQAIEEAAKYVTLPLPFRGALEQYLRGGDEKSLKALKSHIKSAKGTLFVPGFHEFLPHPDRLDEYDERAARFLVAAEEWDQLQVWLDVQLGAAPREAEVFAAVAAKLRALGADETHLNNLAVCSLAREEASPVADSAGRHLLSLDDKTLRALVNEDNFQGIEGLLKLLARHAPERVEPLVPAFAGNTYFSGGDVGQALLEVAPDRFEHVAVQMLRRADEDVNSRLELGRLLIERDAAKYTDEVAQIAKASLASSYGYDVSWLIPALGPAIVEEIARHAVSWYPGTQREVVDLIAKHGGAKAGAALLHIVNSDAAPPAMRAAALERAVELKDPSLAKAIEQAIEAGLGGDARTAAKFAPAAIKSGIPKFRDQLWSQLGAKSKIARAAAAEALAGSDAEALDRASALLTEKSKDLRWGAVLVLAHLATPPAVDVLLHRLPREQDEDVRNEMTRAVRNAGVSLEAIVKALGPTDLEKLRERGRQHRALPVKWLKEDELPELKMLDGKPLDRDLVRFLLHRQAGQSEAVPDPEAAPLYTLIDRRTSGDFALKLLDAFFESERGKADAWTLITGGMLGDNRAITLLASKIRSWADGFDQKLGEFGIEALALNGSAAALMAVSAIAEKYKDNPRKKYNVIGTAAQEALELAAKRMGISMDELGDRIVPTLGFEPGRPRIVEAGGRTIEATIGLDFKLSMKDAKTGKKAVSIPKAAPPEVQAEFKGLGKLLVEAAKSQSARLEALMVRQHRWAAPHWDEIFLRHPLLFPFAVRLVWGAYDADGRIVSTFRALPDRTLTDAHDEPVELDKSLAVGIVHPLDLTREQIEAWQQHLGDYEIAPPFLQIERQLVTVPEKLRGQTKYDKLKGATMNAMSFRGKVERSGWTRGAVGDGGMVGSYRKRFSTSGIDAFVTVEGMPVYGYDPGATATIGEVVFLPLDTKPADFTSSLIKLGEVPVMVFSETVGDLMRITGKIDGAGEDGTGAEAAGDQEPTASQTV
jgi:hypothetical protein